MHSIVMVSVQLCWVIYAECHIRAIYTKCHYTECRCAECRYAECCGAGWNPPVFGPPYVLLSTMGLKYYL